MKTDAVAAVRGAPAFLLMAACFALLPGCASSSPGDLVPGRSYRPANVYRPVSSLPDHLHRVAVLPLTSESTPEAEVGRDQLQKMVPFVLTRREAFEVVTVRPAELQQWTGSKYWAAEDRLPAGFFERLRDEFGCDAVLFCRLTAYRPYSPVAVGWNLKLVDAKAPCVWWSADVVFDAGDPAVANAARRYHRKNLADDKPATDSRIILSSPQQFGEYSLSALLKTLPERAP
jgi:hypothetical protein